MWHHLPCSIREFYRSWLQRTARAFNLGYSPGRFGSRVTAPLAPQPRYPDDRDASARSYQRARGKSVSDNQTRNCITTENLPENWPHRLLRPALHACRVKFHAVIAENLALRRPSRCSRQQVLPLAPQPYRGQPSLGPISSQFICYFLLCAGAEHFLGTMEQQAQMIAGNPEPLAYFISVLLFQECRLQNGAYLGLHPREQFSYMVPVSSDIAHAAGLGA